MKKLTRCLLLVLAAAGLFAQQKKPVVAVMPFTAGSGINASDADAITSLFCTKLADTGKVTVINRAALETIIKEHKFQAGDLANDEKKAKLGKALNAELIVQGKIEKLGDNILVSVQLTGIETKLTSEGDFIFANMEKVHEKMDSLADSLLKVIK